MRLNQIVKSSWRTSGFGNGSVGWDCCTDPGGRNGGRGLPRAEAFEDGGKGGCPSTEQSLKRIMGSGDDGGRKAMVWDFPHSRRG